MFPYDVYFAMKFEDKFASYQDFLNDPQLPAYVTVPVGAGPLTTENFRY